MIGTIHLTKPNTHKRRLWQWRTHGKTQIYTRIRRVYLPRNPIADSFLVDQ
jgi:hypothetical protein